MKIANKISKINFKVLIFTMFICLFVIVPAVIAISSEPVGVVAQPYTTIVLLAAIGSAAVQFIQEKFIYLKRYFDVITAFSALVLISPLVIVCAVLVKLFSRRGPVLYVQKRVGKNGINFKMYKLRSMVPDAELKTGVIWCEGENDPRIISHVGGF